MHYLVTARIPNNNLIYAFLYAFDFVFGRVVDVDFSRLEARIAISIAKNTKKEKKFVLYLFLRRCRKTIFTTKRDREK